MIKQSFPVCKFSAIVLDQSLSEEKAMAEWIRTNAPDVLMQLWPEIEASIAKREEAKIIETWKGNSVSYNCEACGMIFNSREDLDKHNRQKHKTITLCEVKFDFFFSKHKYHKNVETFSK